MKQVTHTDLLEKLVDHEDRIVKLAEDVHGIKTTLDPIAKGVDSMAFSFRALLALGAAALAIVGILELVEHLK